MKTYKTLRDVKKLAEQYGATVEVSEFDPYDESAIVTVDAPEGQIWEEGPVACLVARFWSYDKPSRYEAYEDLCYRMSFGLTKNNE